MVRDLQFMKKNDAVSRGFSVARPAYAAGAILCIVIIAQIAVSDPLPTIQVEKTFTKKNRVRGNCIVTRDQKFLIAALEDECAVFSRDLENGKLELVQRLFEKPNPVDASWIVATADESRIFLRSHSDHVISYYERDPISGKLTLAGGLQKAKPLNLINDISHMVIHPKDGRLFALANAEDALLVFKNPPSGELEISQIFQDDCAGIKDPFSGITTIPLAGSVKVDRLSSPYLQCHSRDGQFLYVGAGGNGLGAVALFDIRDTTVHFVESKADPPMRRVMGILFPQALVVSPDDRHVYLGCTPFSLVAFARDSTTGKLTWVHTIGDGNRGFLKLDRITAMVMSQSGEFLYVGAIRDKEQSVVVILRRDRESGRLELAESFDDQEQGRISNMTISPDGKFLYTRYNNMHIGVRAIPESWR